MLCAEGCISMNSKTLQKQELFESDKIIRSILIMAVPTIISQVITMIYAYADSIYIGIVNDPSQIAAIALAQPLNHIMTASGNFWGVGGGSMISRSLGEHNYEKLKKASAFSLYGAAAFMIIICLTAFLLGNKLPIWLGASEAVLPYAYDYFLYLFIIGGFPAVMSQVMAHLLRAEGYSKEAGFGLMLGGILNILLDPLFIFAFGLRLKGAAMATALANIISFCYFVFTYYRLRGSYNASFRLKYLSFKPKLMIEIFSVGLPAAIIHLMSAASNLVLNNLLSDFNDFAVAGIGITKKVGQFPCLVNIGFAQGSLPLIAYNYAAGNKERMEKLIKKCLMLNIIVGSILMAVLMIFARPVSSIFIREINTVNYAVLFLRVIGISAPCFAVCFTTTTVFQAVKKPITSLLLSLIRKGIIEIPLMILVASRGIVAVVAIDPIMDYVSGIACIICLVYFLKHESFRKKKE